MSSTSARPRQALEITMPMPQNMANARQHWRVKLNAKNAYYETLDEWQNAGMIPKPPAKPIGKALIRSAMQLGARMDTDNAMARHKWPLDWLQTRGYIANDKDLEWQAFPLQTIKRDGHYRITLTLTEIKP